MMSVKLITELLIFQKTEGGFGNGGETVKIPNTFFISISFYFIYKYQLSLACATIYTKKEHA